MHRQMEDEKKTAGKATWAYNIGQLIKIGFQVFYEGGNVFSMFVYFKNKCKHCFFSLQT